jgi:hypothetical protein
MLEITSEDISLLDDRALRTLVGLLCEAELRGRGSPSEGVTWGGNQNSPDGGIDVRVALPRHAIANGFIPRSLVGFQIKKSRMGPKEIGKEMRPLGAIRPSIKEIAQSSGAYIIVSAKTDVTDSLRKACTSAMKAAVADLPNKDRLLLDFYDRSRIATWVRNHPSLVLWVRENVGKALSGWRPYEAWTFSPDGLDDVYLADKEPRIRLDGLARTAVTAVQGIQRIRGNLRRPRGVVRLIGLSGVGKTRLVQALFDRRIGKRSLDPALAIYTDLADESAPPPIAMASNLIA